MKIQCQIQTQRMNWGLSLKAIRPLLKTKLSSLGIYGQYWQFLGTCQQFSAFIVTTGSFCPLWTGQQLLANVYTVLANID